MIRAMASAPPAPAAVDAGWFEDLYRSSCGRHPRLRRLAPARRGGRRGRHRPRLRAGLPPPGDVRPRPRQRAGLAVRDRPQRRPRRAAPPAADGAALLGDLPADEPPVVDEDEDRRGSGATPSATASEQLDPRQRELILLKFHAQLSNAELAKVLGCSVSNAGTRLCRALERLREVCDVAA